MSVSLVLFCIKTLALNYEVELKWPRLKLRTCDIVEMSLCC